MSFLHSRISKENLADAWIHAMPWILKSVDNDFDELVFIQKGLEGGWYQLWALQDQSDDNRPLFFLITELIVIEKKKTLVLRWAAGTEMERWLDDINILEDIALKSGYDKIAIWGKPGWKRVLQKFGYKLEFTVVSKEIQRGQE